MTTSQISELSEIQSRMEQALAEGKPKYLIDKDTLRKLSDLLTICIREGGIVDSNVGVI